MAVKTRCFRRNWVRLSAAVVPLATLTCLSPQASGQQLWWDPNQFQAGIGGSGTWDTTQFVWSPDATGIRFVGTPPLPNGQTFPNTGAVTATFSGAAGTVSLSGTVSAAGIVVTTTGYRFTGGPLRLGNPALGLGASSRGFIDLAPGVTATFTGSITTNPSANSSFSLRGSGVLNLDGSDLVTTSIRLDGTSRLRLLSPNPLRAGDLILGTGTLDLNSQALVSVGSILQQAVAPRLNLGSTQLTVRNSTALPSSFTSSLTSTATGGLVLAESAATAANHGFSLTAASAIGTLETIGGTTVTFSSSAPLSLTSEGNGALGGRPSLRVGATSTLQVLGSSSLITSGFPELQLNAKMRVFSGSTFSITGSTSEFRIGSVGNASGAFSQVEVGNAGSALTAANDIVLGTFAATNRGIGALLVYNSGTVSARRILLNPDSLLDVALGGAVTAETLISNSGNVRIGETATLTLTGNTVHTVTNLFQNGITGRGGVINITAGTVMAPVDMPFNGTIRLQNSAVRPTLTSLRSATLELGTGSSIDRTLIPSPGTLELGGLAGNRALALTDLTLSLGLGNANASHTGNLQLAAGLLKAGTATQTFTGDTSALSNLAYANVTSGALRFTTAPFNFTRIDASSAGPNPIRVDGPQSSLTIDGGATVTLPDRAYVVNGGNLSVSGFGTSMTVNPVGSFGVLTLGGIATVSNRARLDITHAVMVQALSSAPASSLTIADGAIADIRGFIQFESAASSFVVRQATARVGNLFQALPELGTIELSDPVDGSHALTLGGFGSVSPIPLSGPYTGVLRDSTAGPGSIRKLGTSRFDFNPSTNTLSGRLTVDDGSVAIFRSNVLQASILELNAPGGFNVSSVPNRPTSTLSIGHLAGSAPFSAFDFGQLALGRNVGPISVPAFSGELTTTGTQGLIKVGTSVQQFEGASIDGYALRVVGGEVRLANTVATFDAQGLTGFQSQPSAIFVEGGTRLSISSGSIVNVQGVLSQHNNAAVTLSSGSVLNIVRGPLIEGSLLLGFAGATSTFELSGPDTVVNVSDRLYLGSTFAANPGVGRLTIGAGSTVNAAALRMDGIGSRVVVNGGTLNITGFDSTASQTSSIDLLAGTLNIVPASSIPSTVPIVAPSASTFNGNITGLGSVTKSGPSTVTFTGTLSYTGGTTIQAGHLRLSAEDPNVAGMPGLFDSAFVDTRPGSIFELDVPAAATLREFSNPLAITGGGRLLKSGLGNARFPGGATFSMSAGSVIDVQGGTLQFSGSGSNSFSANRSHLNVNIGAAVSALGDQVRFDALTGDGVVFGGGTPTASITLGVGNTAQGPYNPAGTATFSGSIIDNNPSAGQLARLIKVGTGLQILDGPNFYTGPTEVRAGTLRLGSPVFNPNSNLSPFFDIAQGATLEFNVADGANRTFTNATGTSTRFSGLGRILKTGDGSVAWTVGQAVFNLSPGSIIDVQRGIFTGGSFSNEDWSTNRSHLHVAPGAAFGGIEALVRVDALTGGGLVVSGFAGRGSLTVGVAGTVAGPYNPAGVATFAGAFVDSDITNFGTFIKAGSGTQIITGNLSHTGGTTIGAGTLQIGDNTTTGTLLGNVTNNANLVFHRSNDVVYSGQISGTGNLIKRGNAQLTLSGQANYTGNTMVSAGVLRVASPLRPVTGVLTVTGGIASLQAAPATLAAPASVVAGEFSSTTISNGARLQLAPVDRATRRPNVLITRMLTIVPTGFVDLANNDLILRAGGPSSAAMALTTLSDQVREWWIADNGLPGSRGLGSSLAFYTAAGEFTTLAVYNNALPGQTLTSFNGLPVSATDVLVSYTYLGDTNIDGTVDAADLARILQGMRGAGSGWNFGDVNYDGLINFTDLGRAMAALRGQGAPLGNAASGTPGGVIPEPASLSLLALPAFALTRRRRS